MAGACRRSDMTDRDAGSQDTARSAQYPAWGYSSPAGGPAGRDAVRRARRGRDVTVGSGWAVACAATGAAAGADALSGRSASRAGTVTTATAGASPPVVTG